jgi:hypothetical protein
MADYDSNMIKPVESLKNITGLTPAKRREERKRRQQLHQENEENGEQELNEAVDESAQGQGDVFEEWTGNEHDQNPDDTGIDYCA